MTDANQGQIDFWNGDGGGHWVNRQEAWDVVLAPVLDAVLSRANVRAGERVIDVGCGCGATTIAIGQRVGPKGHVLGLDVSTRMLERATQRCPPGLPVTFTEADATTCPLPPGNFDLVVSRFGVMFFADPTRSFANLRKGLVPGGRVVFACFRTASKNPWMNVPLNAAYEHVPPLAKLGPEDPGPFSFTEEARVRGILEGAGFEAVALEPVDLMLDLGSGQGLDMAVDSVMEIGPASRAVEGQPDTIRAAVAQSLRRALTPFQSGPAVSLAAAIWIVTARNA